MQTKQLQDHETKNLRVPKNKMEADGKTVFASIHIQNTNPVGANLSEIGNLYLACFEEFGAKAKNLGY
jgi:hypothetical protein